MDDIFAQMQSVRNNLPSNILNLLESVLALRDRQWDHGSPIPSSSSHTQNGFTNNYAIDSSAVLLSAEESEFFYENCNDFNDYFV